MAKATAICTCKFCGKKFEKIAFKHNRTEADSFVKWAEENCTQCPECWKESVRENEAEAAEKIIRKFNLPEITGKSEKQIAYATSLRNKELAQKDTDKLIEEMTAPFPEKAEQYIKEEMEKTGESRYEVMSRNLFGHQKKVWSIVNIADARTLIDMLLRY